MNNTKIVYDCEKNSTSFVPMSAAELAYHAELQVKLITEETIEELETPVE